MNKFILILVLVLAPAMGFGADVVEVRFVAAGKTQTPVRFVNVVPVRQVFVVVSPPFHVVPFHNSQFVITQVAITSSATFISNEWRY
jgi:hypothetical protein